MPRAEIPEGVERYTEPERLGPWIHIEDLPKLHQHWLAQVKEGLEERLADERSHEGEMHVHRASAFGDALADLAAYEAAVEEVESRG